MKKTLGIVFVIMLTWVCTPVYAAPSINGTTGLINMPTADVLRTGRFSLGLYGIKNGYTNSFTMGLLPGFEVGVADFRYNNKANLPNNTIFNAKLSLAQETILTPGVAVGIEDIADNDKRSCYISASKGLIWGLRFHAGIGSGRYGGPFIAVEKTISSVKFIGGGVTNLIAEWDGNQMNYGIRMAVSPKFRIDAGLRKQYGYFGVSFTS